MRALLFTGKGGVGKTTAAAATAALAASRGCKTLVLSTDGAHSLADAFGVPLGPEPTEIDPGLALFGQQVDTQGRFERAWRDVQSWLVDLLARQGVDPLEAEELTVLPGAEEVLALLEVRDQLASGRWDLVVVDCAPTAETLRLLALPQALQWWMSRVWAAERRMLRSLRPLLGRVSSAPVPGERVLDAVERLHAELAEVHAVLTDPMVTGVRLVLTPEAVVVAEARRTLTSLALYGYRVDGVVANRVFPAAGADAWRSGWVAAQEARLVEIDESFSGLPVRRAAYRPAEPVGLAALTAWGEDVYGEDDVTAVVPPAGPDPVSVEQTTDGFALVLALPLAERGDVDLSRRGDELVVTVGGRRRVLSLPSVLRRCLVEGAGLREGRLVVRFAPDPDLWPRGGWGLP